MECLSCCHVEVGTRTLCALAETEVAKVLEVNVEEVSVAIND